MCILWQFKPDHTCIILVTFINVVLFWLHKSCDHLYSFTHLIVPTKSYLTEELDLFRDLHNRFWTVSAILVPPDEIDEYSIKITIFLRRIDAITYQAAKLSLWILIIVSFKWLLLTQQEASFMLTIVSRFTVFTTLCKPSRILRIKE